MDNISILTYNLDYYIENPGKMVDELIGILGESNNADCFSLGLRGGYEAELNQKYLYPSILNLDDQEDQELSGTSCISFVPDWDDANRRELINGFIDCLFFSFFVVWSIWSPLDR